MRTRFRLCGIVAGVLTLAAALMPALAARAGALPLDAVGQVVGSHSEQLRGCYEQARRDGRTVPGELFLDLAIAPDGRVQGVSITSPSVLVVELEGCIREVARSMVFPHPEGEGAAFVRVPVDFLVRAPQPLSPLAPLPERAPVTERFTLANGLRVLLQRDEHASQAAVCTVYGVGSRDDPAGHHGLAHLVEHMAFRGSENARHGYRPILERARGSSWNGTTEPDFTRYFETVPEASLDQALWVEADRMAYLLTGLTEDQLADDQRIVIREWHERGGGGALDLMWKAVRHELYPEGHPYRELGDEPDDVERVRLSGIQSFFQRFYQPNNARLAVVGRFDPERVRSKIEAEFGSIVPQHLSPQPRREPPFAPGIQETVVYLRGDVGRDRVLMSWPSPAFMHPGDAELDLVAELLVGRGGSPLQREVVGARLGSAVGAAQSSQELGSLFSISAVGGIGARGARLARVIDVEVARLSRELVSADTLGIARRSLQNRLRASYASPSTRACSLASWMTPQGGVADLPYQLARYDNITPEAVRRAVQRYLRPSQRIVARLDTEPRSGPVRVIRVERR